MVNYPPHKHQKSLSNRTQNDSKIQEDELLGKLVLHNF
jgi:hypothetical protein